jgi:hypothetical protein
VPAGCRNGRKTAETSLARTLPTQPQYCLRIPPTTMAERYHISLIQKQYPRTPHLPIFSLLQSRTANYFARPSSLRFGRACNLTGNTWVTLPYLVQLSIVTSVSKKKHLSCSGMTPGNSEIRPTPRGPIRGPLSFSAKVRDFVSTCKRRRAGNRKHSCVMVGSIEV